MYTPNIHALSGIWSHDQSVWAGDLSATVTDQKDICLSKITTIEVTPHTDLPDFTFNMRH
jgi:hypothetical protein